MGFLKNLFKSADEPIKSYADFWAWFHENEKNFFNIVKSHDDIAGKFLNKLGPKLAALKEDLAVLTGMCDVNTVELVVTADGNIKNIAYVEELIAAAPKIDGWKFTALKPALQIEDVSIHMADMEFSEKNLFFYANVLPTYPDEIDISIVHMDMTTENAEQVKHGTYIFLDNYLGELDFVCNIDNVRIIAASKAEQELIPMAKLKDFLKWRQKEFVEKYQGFRYDTDKDDYTILEAELSDGNALIAVVNTNLLNWDDKASHPWLAVVVIKYDGSQSNGMPNDKDYDALALIEEEIMRFLIDADGYLNIGRQTAANEREIYFACAEFRKPSKVLFEIQQKYSQQYSIEFNIYKDKYWQSLEWFKQP
jgi:hypothetical protein